MSNKFVRSNGGGGARLSGASQQRLYGDQVSMGEPFQLHGNAELTRDIQSSLEIIAQERLLEVETQAKALLIRAKAESSKILEQTNAQTKAMLAQAQGEVDAIRESAHEEGFKAGYEEGYSDATAQVTQETQDLLAGAQLLVDGAYIAEKRVMKHFEARTLELIRHIVRQILDREMTEAPATVMRLVERAMDSLYFSGKVQVVVSAQVIHELRAYATATEKSLDGMNRFEFIADSALDRNQIYIIGQDSCFDLSPNTQVDHLLEALEPHFELPREIPEEGPTAAALDFEPEALAITGEDEGLDPVALETLDSLQSSVMAPLDMPARADEPIEPLLRASVAEPVTRTFQPEALSTQPVGAMELLPVAPESAFDESALAATELATEPDPVAWEEFPPEIQQLDGFPIGDESADMTAAVALSETDSALALESPQAVALNPAADEDVEFPLSSELPDDETLL